jgi:hypothetical protein
MIRAVVSGPVCQAQCVTPSVPAPNASRCNGRAPRRRENRKPGLGRKAPPRSRPVRPRRAPASTEKRFAGSCVVTSLVSSRRSVARRRVASIPGRYRRVTIAIVMLRSAYLAGHNSDSGAGPIAVPGPKMPKAPVLPPEPSHCCDDPSPDRITLRRRVRAGDPGQSERPHGAMRHWITSFHVVAPVGHSDADSQRMQAGRRCRTGRCRHRSMKKRPDRRGRAVRKVRVDLGLSDPARRRGCWGSAV